VIVTRTHPTDQGDRMKQRTTRRTILTVRADELRLGDLIVIGGTKPIEVTSIAQMRPNGNVHINTYPAFNHIFRDDTLELTRFQKIRIERD
jgi:hypothetical protein